MTFLLVQSALHLNLKPAVLKSRFLEPLFLTAPQRQTTGSFYSLLRTLNTSPSAVRYSANPRKILKSFRCLGTFEMRPITLSIVFIFNNKWSLLLVAQLVNDYTETNNIKWLILQTPWQKLIVASTKAVLKFTSLLRCDGLDHLAINEEI